VPPLSVRGRRVLGRGARGLLGRGAARVLGLGGLGGLVFGGLGFGRIRGPRIRVSRRVRGIRRPHDADVGPCRRIRALLLRRGIRALDALGIGTGTLGSGAGTLGVGALGGVVGAVSTGAAGARIAGAQADGTPLVAGRPLGVGGSRLAGRTAGLGAVSGLPAPQAELSADHAAGARSLGGRVLLAGPGVRTATVAQVHDATVGRGPLVGADPELTAQGSGQQREEAAAGAVGRDGAASAPPGGRPGAEVALDPAFGGVGA